MVEWPRKIVSLLLKLSPFYISWNLLLEFVFLHQGFLWSIYFSPLQCSINYTNFLCLNVQDSTEGCMVFTSSSALPLFVLILLVNPQRKLARILVGPPLQNWLSVPFIQTTSTSRNKAAAMQIIKCFIPLIVYCSCIVSVASFPAGCIIT